VTAHLVAAGGGILLPDSGNLKLEKYCLSLARNAHPRVLFIGTASGDDPVYLARFYESYGQLGCRTAHLPFFRRTPLDLRALVFEFDVVHVGGGNTRSMLAVWRDWGLVEILREAWSSGIVLCGSSAGAICWFEEGVTDSLAGELTRMNCLGFVGGSACPHYDGEKERRPAYQRMVASGSIAPGYACDDGAALHFVDRTLRAAIAARPAARAYHVERDPAGGFRESVLPATLL
jgi:dipeptidase E